MSTSRAAGSFTRLSQGTSSLFVCRQCRYQAAQHPQTRALSSNAVRGQKKGWGSRLSETFRKRIWGTDTPPRQKDPSREEGKALRRGTQAQRDDGERAASEEERMQGRGKSKPQQIDESNYVPATNWDGLMAIGGPTGWWEEAWDEEHQFEGFMSATALDSKEDIEKVIRRALIEVHVMQEGMPLDNAMTAYETGKEREHFVMKYPELLKRAYFVAGERGQHAKLVFAESPLEDVDMTEDHAITSLAEAEAISISEILEEILGMPAPTDAWRDVSISDLKVKFAVLKRVTQLSGRRIPDYAIANLTTANDLLHVLAKKPKPKKLADILTVKEALKQLPNVEIKERRFTPIDREKEVGRWKVIEKELARRDLPITGKELPPRYV